MQSIKNPLVTFAAAIVIIGGMHLAAPIVNLILLSFLLAMAVTPFMEWAIRKGMRPGLAVTITVLVVVVAGLVLAGLMGASILRMIDKMPVYQPRLAEVRESLMTFLTSIGIDPTGFFASFQLDTQKIVQLATKLLSAGFGMLSMSLVIIMIVVFILIEAAGHLAGTLQQKESKTAMSRYFLVGGDVRKYLNIVALTGLLVGLFNTILLFVLGVDFPGMWGVMSFLFNFVPNFGFIFSVIPPALLALLEFGWGRAIIVVIGFVLINSASENIIKPRFMKKGLEISLLLIFLSLIIWTWALGPMGTILGVPLTMVLYRMYQDYQHVSAQAPLGKS